MERRQCVFPTLEESTACQAKEQCQKVSNFFSSGPVSGFDGIFSQRNALLPYNSGETNSASQKRYQRSPDSSSLSAPYVSKKQFVKEISEEKGLSEDDSVNDVSISADNLEEIKQTN